VSKEKKPEGRQEHKMAKKYTSIILFVSLVALGSSGLLMMFPESLAFRLRMHPVHNIFGIAMCISGCLHVCFNFRLLKSYFKHRQILIMSISLVVVLILSYTIGLHRPIDPLLMDKIESVMTELKQQR